METTNKVSPPKKQRISLRIKKQVNQSIIDPATWQISRNEILEKNNSYA